ncbi:MAG: capsular polysaccharide synthesis protein [Agathobacter sp.]|nr:capsular polysaccharide synthesis protein [Agathobacter sp.]
MKAKKKVILYGAGDYAKSFLDKYMNYLIEYFEIIAIVDRNYEHCESLGGYIVEHPDVIRSKMFDNVCILSMYCIDEIREKLITEYDVEEDRVELTDFLLAPVVEKRFGIRKKGVNWNDKQILWDYMIPNNKYPKGNVLLWESYNMLKEKYGYYLKEKADEVFEDESKGIHNKTIWICWLQGMEKAPDIVRACYNSVKKQMYDYDIKLVTEKNLCDYISVPDVIEEKYKKGLIGKAHYSDYIRCELLIKYGGIWIDATVLLTQRIPDVILNSKIFMFDLSNVRELSRNQSSNWFIVSVPQNKILVLVRDLLIKYWEENDEAINYFIMHIFMRMVFEHSRDRWNSMKHMAVNAYYMCNLLNASFDAKEYEYIKNISFIHKLTYKKKIDYEKENFYNHILGEWL